MIFWNFLPVTLGHVGGMAFIDAFSTHRTPIDNVLPAEHDEKLERNLLPSWALADHP